MKFIKKIFEHLYYEVNLIRLPVGVGMFAIKIVAEVERGNSDDRFEA